jgi:ABC-2 type transport system permease protein
MIRLIGVEIRRLFSRRFTVVTLIVIFLGLGAFQLAVAQEISPLSSAELVEAQRNFDSEHAAWVESHVQNEKDCVDAGNTAEECAQPEPTLDQFTGETSFPESVGIGLGLSIYLAAFASFLVGASYIGAEYSTGSLGNWLSFIPRRALVFSSKLVTITAFGTALSAVAATFVLAAAVILASIYDVPVTGMAGLTGTAARGLLIALALAAVGFCVGLLTRHTAAAIGVLSGYLFIWFVRNAFLAEQAWSARLTPFAPEANISAIVNKVSTYEVPVRTITGDGLSTDFVQHTIGLSHGLVYWGVLLLIVVGGTWLVFRRRDVT